MYSQWLYDQEEMHKMWHHYTTYVGMFSNYEMAKSIMGSDGQRHQSSSESLDESSRAVESMEDEKILAAQKVLANRKNRKVVK